MIFKILYQEKIWEVPVREKTKAMYIEADSEMDVRKKLASRDHNIEFILPVEGAFLSYEKQNENFQLEKI